MRLRLLLILLLIIAAAGGVVWFLHVGPFAASQPPKIYHIGVLARGRGSYELAVQGFKAKLTEFGYVEGKNVVYDIRYLSTKEELEKASADMITNRVDLINTYSTPATQTAYRATAKMAQPIPVVFGSIGDPIAAGVIKDIQHPGTNVTGVISSATELTTKRVELLKRIKPDIKVIAMPHSAPELNDVAANKSVDIAKKAARDFGVTLTLLPVRTADDNALVAAKITRNNADSIIVGGDSLVWSKLEKYAEQAKREKIPFAVFDTDQVKRGGLVGFGPDYYVNGQQAAAIAHQILQGRKPQDIAVETPLKLLLAVNLDTARAIGITFTPEFLKDADVIIGK